MEECPILMEVSGTDLEVLLHLPLHRHHPLLLEHLQPGASFEGFFFVALEPRAE